MKYRLNTGKLPELYFLRDSKGLEVDLVIRQDHEHLIPVEIKGGSTWNAEFSGNLLKIRKLSPKFASGYVVYAGSAAPEINGVRFLNFKDTEQIFLPQ